MIQKDGMAIAVAAHGFEEVGDASEVGCDGRVVAARGRGCDEDENEDGDGVGDGGEDGDDVEDGQEKGEEEEVSSPAHGDNNTHDTDELPTAGTQCKQNERERKGNVV
eukprot:1087433-Rhodomonas_salina.1